MPRYRVGLDRRTMRLISGRAHVEQSVAFIIASMRGDVVMLYDLGADIVRLIGRNIGRDLLLDVYAAIASAVHRWEPEYRVKQLELVALERTGGVAVRLRGLYYPEGRFGNYDLAENSEIVAPLARAAA